MASSPQIAPFSGRLTSQRKKRAGDNVGLIAEVQNKCYRPNLNGGKLTSVPTTRFGSTNGAAIILFYFILQSELITVRIGVQNPM